MVQIIYTTSIHMIIWYTAKKNDVNKQRRKSDLQSNGPIIYHFIVLLKFLCKNKKKFKILQLEFEKCRRELLRSEYPLPNCFRSCTWIALLLWCIIASVIIIVWSIQFDLIVERRLVLQQNSALGLNGSVVIRRDAATNNLLYTLNDGSNTDLSARFDQSLAEGQCSFSVPLVDRFLSSKTNFFTFFICV